VLYGGKEVIPLKEGNNKNNMIGIISPCSFLSDTKTGPECGITERWLKNKG
jgi:hypothetical protein